MSDLLERLRAALGDRYAIESEIGRGGMAVVFLAEDLKHHRKVAIKVLHPELAATLGAERFLQEIEIAARLDHPQVVALFDSGQADGLLYYVMPNVEGETLRDRLKREGQIPVEEAVRLAAEVVDGLAYAHEHRVVHRDVKPANILLSAGHARIADFGIARAIDAAAEDRTTATGLAAGTPMYMAPEQGTGEARGDERSDIYSVGCMLYEMLVGEPPFSGVTPQVIQARKMTESAPSIRLVRDTVSPGLEGVVARSIARVPADRFQTALELKRALEIPERDEQEQGVTSRLAHPGMRRRPRLSPTKVIVALLAVTALGYAGMSFVDSGPGPGIDKPEIRSLAVLPLHNRSEDQNQEHFSDGLTEALIGELAQINALEKVPSLTTALTYKGVAKALPEIARELSVDAVIEGSWLRSGDEVEIRLRLIHGNSEEQLWSEEFAGNVSNVPTLLRRVSQAAADSIHVALSPAERERLAQTAYSPHPKAYDAYMMGRYHINRFGYVDAPKANQYFEEAIALDPMYALAHAALAESCIFLPVFAPTSSPLEIEECERLARRALELDEDLPDAHSALALVRTLKWDWEGAEESFRRAIDLKPNSATAHLWYGWFLSIVVRLDESLVEARRAEELDRRNLFVMTMVAQPLMNGHRYDEALAQMDAVLEMDPEFGAAHIYKSHAYALSGRPNEALESAQRAASRLGESYIGVHVMVGLSHALVGETDRALATIDRIQELFGEASAPAVAPIYLALGREEDALQSLEVGYRAHSPWLPNQTSWPTLDGLRDHPRFQEMRRGMGLD